MPHEGNREVREASKIAKVNTSLRGLRNFGGLRDPVVTINR